MVTTNGNRLQRRDETHRRPSTSTNNSRLTEAKAVAWKPSKKSKGKQPGKKP